jgi:hypothetical protein
MSDYQPIETCPHDELVLLWTEHDSYRPTIGKYCPHRGHWLDIEFFEIAYNYKFKDPTHWMPLPMGPNPATLS